MGGSIAIAARFNDGQTICVDGWTNFIPRMVMNDATLSGDDAVVRQTLLEVASHPSYSGPQPFREHGYGMVVIDFVGRTIHSKQGYTSFDRKTLAQMLDINATGWKDGVYVNVISDESGGLLDAGRVIKVSVDSTECEPEVMTRETTIAALDADMVSFMEGGNRKFIGLRIDTAPFTVHEYPENGTLDAMKAGLRAAGFPMTKSEGLNAMLPARSATTRKKNG